MASGNQLKDLILLAKTVEWQYKLEGYTENALKSIMPGLIKAQRDLVNQIELRDIILPPGREDAVLAELNDLTLGIQNRLVGDIEQASYLAAEYSVPAYNSILSFSGIGQGVAGFNFVALSAEQLRAIATGPVDGHTLSEWVASTFEKGIPEKVRIELVAGALKGSSTADIVNSIREGNKYTQEKIISLTRTWIADANNLAAQAVYEANSDIIKYEVWNATLEISLRGSSTCMRCAGLDQRKWPIGTDHPRPPLHIRCRCHLDAETVSYRELGLDIDEIKKAARPYTIRDGKFPIDVGGKRQIIDVGQFDGDFKDFFKSQGMLYQKDLVGPGRYKLLQEGKVKWEDLVDKNGNIVLLKDLEK